MMTHHSHLRLPALAVPTVTLILKPPLIVQCTLLCFLPPRLVFYILVLATLIKLSPVLYA